MAGCLTISPADQGFSWERVPTAVLPTNQAQSPLAARDTFQPRIYACKSLFRPPSGKLVAYELNHAHFVQDIFEVITIYLKIQHQIAVRDTSNFP